MWITGGFQIPRAEIPVGAHLTDDEHVLSLDDTLLQLGLQRLTNISLILITVSCVNVAITGGDAGFYCTLGGGGGKIGGLQQVKPGCRTIPGPYVSQLRELVSKRVHSFLKTTNMVTPKVTNNPPSQAFKESWSRPTFQVPRPRSGIRAPSFSSMVLASRRSVMERKQVQKTNTKGSNSAQTC